MGLHGNTILITRAANQTEELRSILNGIGARVVECPAIEFAPVDDWTPVDRAISDLDSYHWLLFTSSNAVEAFMKRLETIRNVSPGTQIAVVGSATARTLARWHLHASLVPRNFRAEGLLEEFPADLTAVRILFPRTETARELLPEELRRRGATVDVVPVYRTVKATGMQDLRQTLAAETIDCVVFTSPSAVRFFGEAVENDLAEVLHGIAIAVIGPVTRAAAESVGLKPAIEPEHATAAELADAIRRHFS